MMIPTTTDRRATRRRCGGGIAFRTPNEDRRTGGVHVESNLALSQGIWGSVFGAAVGEESAKLTSPRTRRHQRGILASLRRLAAIRFLG